MTRPIRFCLSFVFFLVALSPAMLTTSPAAAQAWPTRTVRIVLPVPPGGASDLVARVLAERLQAKFGQTFVIENKGGGNTLVGTDYVSQQAPDGYTLLFTQSTMATATAFAEKLNFDPVTSFEPIALVADTPMAIIVPATSPIKTFSDLIELAKTKKLTYGTPGIGSPQHLFFVEAMMKAGINMTNVSYRGSAPITIAVASDEISVGVAPALTIAPYVQSGRVRVIAMATNQRTKLMPDVPAVTETMPGVFVEAWLGMFAPARTPKAIIDRLNSAVNEIIRDPQVIATNLDPAGLEVIASSPEKLAEIIQKGVPKYRELIKAANIKPE